MKNCLHIFEEFSNHDGHHDKFCLMPGLAIFHDINTVIPAGFPFPCISYYSFTDLFAENLMLFPVVRWILCCQRLPEHLVLFLPTVVLPICMRKKVNKAVKKQKKFKKLISSVSRVFIFSHHHFTTQYCLIVRQYCIVCFCYLTGASNS